MKLKVCGMREDKNIRELLELTPDFMGMIFYARSPRVVSSPIQVQDWPESIKRVGVFVNQPISEVMEKVSNYQLDYVQLHGGESLDFVKQLHQAGLSIIKVFSVKDELPVDKMKPYEAFVDYFLFDTKTPQHGGSGRKFDWSILSDYTLDTPFFLSGGIDKDDMEEIKGLKLDKLEVIDINSRFEIEPGFKDIGKIKEFKEAL